MTTIAPNFQVFFRATMQFLLAEKGYPSAYIDFLLTLNWSKGNSQLPPDQEIHEIIPVKADDSVLLMATTGNFGVAREGFKASKTVPLFSGLDKLFVVKPNGMPYFMPSPGVGYAGRRPVAIR
jgi:hypothetical protein